MRRQEQRRISEHGFIRYCSCSNCVAYNKKYKRDLNKVFRRRIKQQDQKELVRLNED